MEFKNSWKSYENYLDIVNEVDKLLENCNYKNRVDIVITGGEPLLYWNNQEFQNLIKHYINKNHKLTIETNASLNIDFQEEYQKIFYFQ